jgi:hypothetical protein
MSLEIFVVFHKNIIPESYKELTESEMKYITFVAVNENIKKDPYDSTKYKVINEWEFPIYDPSLQKNKFNENSVIHHIFKNNRVKTKYVGFTQYDMCFMKNSINDILSKIEASEKLIYFGAELQDYETCFFYTWRDFTFYKNYYIFDSLKKGYEILTKKNIDKNKKFPLLNTYIISAETYNKIMPLAIHLYNYSINNNFFEHGHNFQDQAGIFERVMAFLVGQEADFFEMCSIIHFAKQT